MGTLTSVAVFLGEVFTIEISMDFFIRWIFTTETCGTFFVDMCLIKKITCIGDVVLGGRLLLICVCWCLL